MNEVLVRWHELSVGSAEEEILPCNGSGAWARGMAMGRPYADETAVLQAADAVWAGLNVEGWQAAFYSHPRLGEREARAATERSLGWSEGEQSGVSNDAEAVQAALREANRAYEERFERIFLLCATGKTAQEVLECLEQRMGNDAGTEWREAGEQQRRITQLRLRTWMGMAAARCEDV